MTRPGWGALVFLLVMTMTATVRAQNVSSARLHYQRGTTYYDLGRYHEAAKEYEAAFELKDDPALLFNIAQAYRLAHEYADAVRAYRAYLRRLPNADNATEVEARIHEMQELINQQRSTEQRPPLGTIAPTMKPAESPPPATTAAATATATAPERKPLYKKWWLWTAVGVVAVGAAVGIGVGVAVANQNSFNATLGHVGPALTVVLP